MNIDFQMSWDNFYLAILPSCILNNKKINAHYDKNR